MAEPKSKTTKSSAVKKSPVKKAPAKSKEPTTEERLLALEKKFQTLVSVLHHNFAKDLVKGPKDLASKIRKNGLLE